MDIVEEKRKDIEEKTRLFLSQYKKERNMKEGEGKIYKFLRENNIEDISSLIKYRLGEIDYNNPDGIEIEIEPDNKTSLIYVLVKYKECKKFFYHNSGLHTFLMENMPKKELGKLLLLTYIKEHFILTPQHLINCVYDDCYLPSYNYKKAKGDLYLRLEFGEDLKVKRVYFIEKNIDKEKEEEIEVNIEDFYEILSSLGK